MDGLTRVLAPEQIIQLMLVVARVGGMFATAPVLSHQGTPLRVRAGIVVAIAIAFTALVPPGTAAGITTAWGLAGAMVVEAATGVLLGLIPQFIVSGVMLGGEVAGLHMGLGMSRLLDPMTRINVTPIALWFQFLGILMFLALDVHHLLIRALARSFTVAPPGQLTLGAAEIGGMLSMVGGVFEIGLRIAAPVLAGLLIIETGMGLLARAIPELNVFLLGFAIKIGVGFMLLSASLPFVGQFLELRYRGLESVLANLVHALG
jgi:flagellar biosynthetic protein FliR